MIAKYDNTVFGERRKFAEQLKAVHAVTAVKRRTNSLPNLDAKYGALESAVKNLLDDLSPGWEKT